MVGESEQTLRYQEEAKDTLQDIILPFLEAHGKEIGRKGHAGDALCQEIMKRYQLVYDFAELISIGLLEDSIQEYKKREGI